MMTHQKAIVVVGDGWAALGAVGFLAHAHQPVCWIKGSGVRMLAPLPTFEAGSHGGAGVQAWFDLAQRLGIDCGQPDQGSYVREFRNKAFREPVWTKAPTPETRKDVLKELLWAPESRFPSVFESRFSMSAGELEEAIRKELTEDRFACIRRIEGIPVSRIQIGDHGLENLALASGEVIACDRLIYADRWTSVNEIQGLPPAVQKALSSGRKREPAGILQATFTHEIPMGIGITEGFFGSLNKEPGEEIERHVWGYFSFDGKRSFWTLCLSREEVEDNHEITKKLRRMKGALDKMFTGTAWLPPEKRDFMANVTEEQVRFEDALIYGAGDLTGTLEELSSFPKKLSAISFLTDGFGPTLAMEQVALLFGTRRTDTQAEHVDVVSPVLGQ
ncbi:MAG: hypothetical protein A2428_05165 [Bdellovibrionales bacterium RIFOXYC1_FULL_54_43]|nr:MAG: hypothetical protein A2428_05165 [Bdellovibrionales bacterium RIFOXYC1_FULL_54_43]